MRRAALSALLFGFLVIGATPASPSTPARAPCGTAQKPPRTYRHVIVVVLENKSFAQVARSSPYLNTLAGRCGLASNYLAITHPSLPNYIALTSGSTGGITSNCTDCRVATRSIFEQLGPGWRSYLEAMPRAGYRGAASGTYVKKHNPAAYYTRIARAYARQAVPLGTLEAGPLLGDLRRDTLRRFSFLVPDLCHDEHDCPVAVGDAWLSRWIPVILASPGYRRGGTALFITYDEGTYSDNHVYTVVVSPSTPPGTIVGTALDHYSLLRAFESLLGFRCLGHACERQATSVLESFRLR